MCPFTNRAVPAAAAMPADLTLQFEDPAVQEVGGLVTSISMEQELCSGVYHWAALKVMRVRAK